MKYGGKTKDKKEENQPGPTNYQVKSEDVEVLEYSIYKKCLQKLNLHQTKKIMKIINSKATDSIWDED